jgi:hypothetical protein
MATPFSTTDLPATESESLQIRLPYKYKPRPYQEKHWQAVWEGAKRIVLVDHRRSGKDLDIFNLTITRAAMYPGIYYYIFPTFAQARKVIWEGMTRPPESRPFMDYIPEGLIEGHKRDDEMKVKLKTVREGVAGNSIFQLVGSDNFDHLMGTNPSFVVFSEYSLQDPRAWDYFRPILRENKGIAVFVYTPRGDNHGKKLYDLADKLANRDKDPDWYCERLTVDMTTKWENGKLVPILSQADIQKERMEGMSEEMIKQEYYVDFNVSNYGAIYADLIEKAQLENRIMRDFKYDPNFPVYTFWDIGFSDDTAIWFAQEIRHQWRFIDFYANRLKPLEHYIKYVKELGYNFMAHVGPHDLAQTTVGTGVSTWEMAARFGIRFDYAPNISKLEGIQCCRKLLQTCAFNIEKCDEGQGADNGLFCLRDYHYKWDDTRKRFNTNPEHGFSSHAADSFRMAATWILGHVYSHTARKIIVPSDWKISDYVSSGVGAIRG